MQVFAVDTCAHAPLCNDSLQSRLHSQLWLSTTAALAAEVSQYPVLYNNSLEFRMQQAGLDTQLLAVLQQISDSHWRVSFPWLCS